LESPDITSKLAPTELATQTSSVRNQDAVAPKNPKPVIEKADPREIVHELEKAVDILNHTVKREDVALRFRVDETLNRPVVTVLSEETGEVIRQLPQEEVLRAVRNIDQMKGVLLEGLI
jgi:flagellar protein FlaG